MKLLTWNIQWGLGCDGNVDLPRIVDTAKAFCDADVFCFQEVSCGFVGVDAEIDLKIFPVLLIHAARSASRYDTLEPPIGTL